MLKGLPEEGTEIDSFLRKEGFKCREQEPDGVQYSKWRYYIKDLRQFDSNVMLRLVIRFDIQIHDDPGGSYDDNHEFFYENTYITVFDRRMVEDPSLFDGDMYYDEETESLRKVDKYRIHIQEYGDIQKWMDLHG
jgi:hypothetical protein